MIVALPGPFIGRGLFVGVSSAFWCMGEVESFDCGAPWAFHKRGLFVGVSSAFCCMGEVVSFDCGAPWAFHKKGSLRRGLICFLLHGRGCVI